MNKIYDWRELKLQSMDLILCSGNYRMSKAIQYFQRLTGAPPQAAYISHVAALASTPQQPDYGNSQLLQVQESTTLNKWADQEGVQVNWLPEWLANYNGVVFVRKLDFVRNAAFQAGDYDFWNEHKNDPYESGVPGTVELLLAGLRLHRFVPWYQPLQTKALHCTELVSERVGFHGLWDKVIFPNRMPPWLWYDMIDDWLTCPIGKIIRIK